MRNENNEMSRVSDQNPPPNHEQYIKEANNLIQMLQSNQQTMITANQVMAYVHNHQTFVLN